MNKANKYSSEIWVSIVTVTYNSEATIERTLNSILDQNHPFIEYTIIDGASTDNTLKVIKKFQDSFLKKGIRFHLVTEPDNGIYDAMNKGLKKCTGEIVGILNSDDWYEVDALEKIVSCYKANPEVDVIHGILRNIDANGYTTSVIGYSSRCLSQYMIQHPTCFVKNSVYAKHGYFNTAYKSAADYEFMLRLNSRNCQFHFLEEILANFREGGTSYSMKSYAEAYKVQYNYKIISFPKYVLKAFYLGLKK